MASGLGLCGLLVSFANAFADRAARAMALSATGQYFDTLGQASFVAAGLVAAAFVHLCLRYLTDGIAAAYRVVMLAMTAFLVLSPLFGQMGPLAVLMVLLAKGRTRARIQEELYLSSGTVATHARHIYQKVGVHSKQELLDVIESAGERPAR